MNRNLMSAKELLLEDIGKSIPNKKKKVRKSKAKKRKPKRKKKHLSDSKDVFELRKQYLKERKLRRWYCKIYLKSKLWREVIRPRVLKRDDFMCVHCGDPNDIVVHHRSYKDAVLRGHCDDELETICKDCHHKEHFGSGLKRRTLRERKFRQNLKEGLSTLAETTG